MPYFNQGHHCQRQSRHAILSSPSKNAKKIYIHRKASIISQLLKFSPRWVAVSQFLQLFLNSNCSSSMRPSRSFLSLRVPVPQGYTTGSYAYLWTKIPHPLADPVRAGLSPTCNICNIGPSFHTGTCSGLGCCMKEEGLRPNSQAPHSSLTASLSAPGSAHIPAHSTPQDKHVNSHKTRARTHSDKSKS